MSFLCIKDPNKRNEIVAEYWVVKKGKSDDDTTTTTTTATTSTTTITTTNNDNQMKSKEKDGGQCNNDQVLHGIEVANPTKNDMNMLKSEDMDEKIDRKILRSIIGIKRKYHNGSGGIPVMKQIANGITFLPGDIIGLQTKLNYLLGEYRAGNTFATHNQIVAIADELLRRKHLSQVQYHNINSLINNETSH